MLVLLLPVVKTKVDGNPVKAQSVFTAPVSCGGVVGGPSPAVVLRWFWLISSVASVVDLVNVCRCF